MIPISAQIEEFGRGTWVAELVTSEAAAGEFELSGGTWKGTVVGLPMQDGGRQRFRVVGGKGKLGTVLPEKNYDGSISYPIIIRDILRACGESEGVISGGRVSYYERARGTAGEALNEVCDATGMTWWVDRAGLVNVTAARDTNGAVNKDKCPQLGADVDGSAVLNVEDITLVHPGMTLSNGSVIRHIRWRHDNALTAECSPTQPFPERTNSFYLQTFEAKVDSQNADGSVNVIVDGSFSLGHVRLFSGIPASKVQVNPGERVAVGFFRGNRSRPYAMGFEQDPKAGNALARVNDAIEIMLPPFTFVGLENLVTPVTGVMTAVIPKTLGKIVGPGSLRTKSE